MQHWWSLAAKESGREGTCLNSEDVTILVSGDGRHLWGNGYVYCVATAFKMTDWASEHQICIKFCIKLEHSSAETIRVTQKATAMGNGWSEASSQQHARSGITSRVDFLAKHQNCQVTQPCYRPDLVPCDFWLFPKLKSFPWKGKRFQTIDKIQENTIGQLMTTRRTVWGPKVSMLKGTEASLSYVQCVLHLISSSINVYIFHITWLDTFWTDLVWWQKMA